MSASIWRARFEGLYGFGVYVYEFSNHSEDISSSFEKVAYTVYSVRPSCTFGDTLVIQPGLYADKFYRPKAEKPERNFCPCFGLRAHISGLNPTILLVRKAQPVYS